MRTFGHITVVPKQFSSFSEKTPGLWFSIRVSAEVVRAKSVFILKRVEGIGSLFQDKVGVPVEALVAIIGLTHIPTVSLPITHVAVIWPNMTEASSEPFRALTVEVIAIRDALASISAWIRLTHSITLAVRRLEWVFAFALIERRGRSQHTLAPSTDTSPAHFRGSLAFPSLKRLGAVTFEPPPAFFLTHTVVKAGIGCAPAVWILKFKKPVLIKRFFILIVISGFPEKGVFN